MWIVAIAWLYVALMMAVADAMHPQGGVLSAIFTFLLYGVGPLALVMYLLNTPNRRRARDAEMAGESAQPDAGSHASRDAVASIREEPLVADGAPLATRPPDQPQG